MESDNKHTVPSSVVENILDKRKVGDQPVIKTTFYVKLDVKRKLVELAKREHRSASSEISYLIEKEYARIFEE